MRLDIGSITMKASLGAVRTVNRKIPQKHFRYHYCQDDHLGTNDWDFTPFDHCDTHKQLNGRKTFWQNQLKTFYPLCLNEKEEYLYKHTSLMTSSLVRIQTTNKIRITTVNVIIYYVTL